MFDDIDYKIAKEMTTRDYYICVDQEFIDTYYLVLREFSSTDTVIKNMKKAFELNASSHVREFDVYDLRKHRLFVQKPSNSTVMNDDYDVFVSHILPFYIKNRHRYDNTFVMIGENNDKKRYIIKLSFDDIVYINSISSSVGGSVITSSRCLFSDGFNMMGPVVTNHIFGCDSYIRSGNSSSIYFTGNVIYYIDYVTKNARNSYRRHYS